MDDSAVKVFLVESGAENFRTISLEERGLKAENFEESSLMVLK